jgi:hypothetical protein
VSPLPAPCPTLTRPAEILRTNRSEMPAREHGIASAVIADYCQLLRQFFSMVLSGICDGWFSSPAYAKANHAAQRLRTELRGRW